MHRCFYALFQQFQISNKFECFTYKDLVEIVNDFKICIAHNGIHSYFLIFHGRILNVQNYNH